MTIVVYCGSMQLSEIVAQQADGWSSSGACLP